MVRAKNYETVPTFIKVMEKKTVSLFSGHGVVWTLSAKYDVVAFRADK